MSINLKKLLFKVGDKIDSNPLEFNPTTLTILVGPNNSGKSQALRDIEELSTGKVEKGKVIKDCELNLPFSINEIPKLSSKVIQELLNPFLNKNFPSSSEKHYIKPKLNNHGTQIEKCIPTNFIEGQSSTDLKFWKEHLIPFYLVRLDGKSRFSLVEETTLEDLNMSSFRYHLTTIFDDNDKRKVIRKLTYEVFKLYFVLARTGDKLKIKMSKVEPDDKIEKGGDHDSKEFHKKADLITDLGDGIQSFVGLITGILSLKDTIILTPVADK